jgi:hypothetical protein
MQNPAHGIDRRSFSQRGQNVNLLFSGNRFHLTNRNTESSLRQQLFV